MNHLKRYIPRRIKQGIVYWNNLTKWKGRSRYFCISMQRTGTTSVGDFFDYLGYPTARYPQSARLGWSKYWYDGDFERIFKSHVFKSSQLFEDNPWWYPEFYKVLYHRFPGSRFILFTRDSNAWFRSMTKHSGGNTLGNTRRHCKVYRREGEYYKNLDDDEKFKPSLNETDNLMQLSNLSEHYIQLYEIRNREVREFFNEHDPDALFTCDLNDPHKWRKLGAFIGQPVPEGFVIHSNRSS